MIYVVAFTSSAAIVAGWEWGHVSEPMSVAVHRTITFSTRQLQRKFKHAADFGVTGTYNQAQVARFEQALRSHIEAHTTLVVQGTYRGEPVTHFVNPHTGLNVIRDAENAFISGWRLTPSQLTNVLAYSSL